MKIYLTHCSKEKSDKVRDAGLEVTPDLMYTSPAIQAFMSQCQQKHVNWAILSDLYGVWLPEIKHGWYEKHPDTVAESEFHQILESFDQTLQNYDEIWFYVRPETFHPFYQKVLNSSSLKGRVTRFSELEAIV